MAFQKVTESGGRSLGVVCALCAPGLCKGTCAEGCAAAGASGPLSAAKSRAVNNCSTEGWLFLLIWGLLAGKLGQAALKRARAQQEKCLSQGCHPGRLTINLQVFLGFFSDVLSIRKICC